MKISVITPTLGRLSLMKAVETLRSQTFQNWEHIIAVDDAAGNNSDVIRKMIPDLDDRHKIIDFHKENPRLFADYGVNVGQQHAQGDYLCYLMDDDYIVNEHALQRCVDRIQDRDAILVPMSVVLNNQAQLIVTTEVRVGTVDIQQLFHKRILREMPMLTNYSTFYGEDGIFTQRVWYLAETKHSYESEPFIHHTEWRMGVFDA